MNIKAIKYEVEKDKEFIGQRYKSYTVQKHITYENGEKKTMTRVIFPHIDGEPTKENLDKIKFTKSITQEEWEQLSNDYKQAWLRGIMTNEIAKELYILRGEI